MRQLLGRHERLWSQGLGLDHHALSVLASFGLGEQLQALSLDMPLEVDRAVFPDRHVEDIVHEDVHLWRRCALNHTEKQVVFFWRGCV